MYRTAIPGGAVPTCSTTIPGHVGQSANPQRHITNQTQPAPFWRAFACALAGCTAKVRARQAAFGEVCSPLPYPQSARLLPRLACALNRPLFVRFVQTAQAPPVLALRSKIILSKIVQICATFCIPLVTKKPAEAGSFYYAARMCWIARNIGTAPNAFGGSFSSTNPRRA